MSTPTIVILAGGEGKRFYPLVTDKTMFPLLGKPVLQHTLKQIERAGGQQVIISTNQANHDWVTQYQSSLNITAIRQPEPLGMGDAILHLEEAIGSAPILVMNSADLVADYLIEDLLKNSAGKYAEVVGITQKKYFPGGYLEVKDGLAVSVVEKPGEGNEPSNLVKLVFDYFSEPQTFINMINTAKTDRDDQYEVALQQLMKEHPVHTMTYEGEWQPLKFSHMVLDWMDILLERLKPSIHPSAVIAESAIIEGAVIIEEGARVYDQAVIKGPAYIGKNAIVGTGSLVRGSFIESDANTGFGSEIARSYIGPGCTLHHNFVGDSVLEAEVNPSYGTCFANLRLDRQPVQVDYGKTKIDSNRTKLGSIVAKDVFSGVQCSIMPGVTIGSGVKIFPHKVIYDSIKPGETIK